MYINCKKCGADEIPSTMNFCPQCGTGLKAFDQSDFIHKAKSLKPIHWIGIVILVLFFASFFHTSDTSNVKNIQQSSSFRKVETNETSIIDLMPEIQKIFISVVNKYINDFDRATNELQQSQMRENRKNSISQIIRKTTINNWVGTIESLSTTTDGDAAISVIINPGIYIKTWNNSFSDIGDKTLIAKGTDLYNVLINARKGQNIRFSGQFLQSKRDYIKEGSLTIRGSMKSPEFIFRFSSVTLL